MPSLHVPLPRNAKGNIENAESITIPHVTWPTVSSLPPFSHPNIQTAIQCTFYAPSPSTILKLGVDTSEGIMTALAHAILGSCVPRVLSLVDISDLPHYSPGLLLTRQPGKTLTELWPELTPAQRHTVKSNLATLFVEMRTPVPAFDFYGYPDGRPYRTFADVRGPRDHAFCTTREQWDESRLLALRESACDAEIDDTRCAALELVQRGTVCDDRPVLTHGDLADRNILVDPDTLEVTGLVDWGQAMIAPAYFEYVLARLSGGHDPWWRAELLDVLKAVLRRECEAKSCGPLLGKGGVAEKYRTELAAWDALVNVERPAQGYSDRCYWTFEGGLPPAPPDDVANADMIASMRM